MASHRYRISESINDCMDALEDVYYHTKSIGSDNLLVACSDNFDRLQCWSHSLGVLGEKFESKLKQSPHLLDEAAGILQEILTQLNSARERLASGLPMKTKAEYVEQFLVQVRHAIDRLFEMCPAFEDPALILTSGASAENTSDEKPIELLSSSRDGFEDRGTAAYDCLSEYDTLFVVSNSTASEGWRWELAAQILYQSARRLLLHTRSFPTVRFSCKLQGVPEAELNIDEALEAFHANRKPEGTIFSAQCLDEFLSLHVSRMNYRSNTRRLNLVVISADGLQGRYKSIERVILQNGKKLRLFKAPEGQIVVHLVHIGTDPCTMQDLSLLKSSISIDRAVQGTIEIQYVLFDLFAVSEHTYEDILLRELTAPAQERRRLYPAKNTELTPFEIGVRGLSPHTDSSILRLTFDDYGSIVDLDIDENARGGLHTATIIYDSERDADLAVGQMNGARFDGQVISVYKIGALHRRQAGPGVRNEQGVLQTLGY